MTVLRQLLLSVTVVMAVILAGTLVFSVNGAREYLSAQVQADSDNTATSLALLLSQPVHQDLVLRELLITALFDSGRFQAITLHDNQGGELVARRLQESADSPVPDWFSRMLPLRTPSATRQVMDGWTQSGELTVVADDSEARKALWDTSLKVFWWIVFAGLLWLVFVVGLMRWLKRALQAEITRQVESVADGQAVAADSVRKPLADLLPSSQVIAQARERVQASKQEAAQRIESLTLELNHDAVTGVPNRRYFMNELRRALQEPQDAEGGDDAHTHVGGHVFLSRQRDLAEMAKLMSHQELDTWLRSVGERLQAALAGFPDFTLHAGRLNGPDFAVLISGADGPQAMLVAEAVRNALQEARIPLAPGRFCRWAFAMTDFAPGDELSVVFSRLDTALMAAESAGHTDIELLSGNQYSEGSSRTAVSEAAWRELLTHALEGSGVDLSVHRVVFGKQGRHRTRFESTLTITDPAHNQGEPLSGFSFMPAAVRLGLSPEMDARAIELGLAWLAGNAGELVVRISVASLLKPEFLDVTAQLFGAGQEGVADDCLSRLILELDAYALAAYPAEVGALCEVAHAAGVRVGLRGVAQQLDVVARLQGLPIAYIKLAGGFVADLESSQGAVSLLNAVIHTATTQRIQVLVDDTPGETAAQLLRDHGALLRLPPED